MAVPCRNSSRSTRGIFRNASSAGCSPACSTACAKCIPTSCYHLDLKPSNIYLRSDNTPVLIDFGAARQTLLNDQPMLKPMYTPGFASPEHYGSRKDLGPWSDIYSVGASMYACLAGVAPPAADSRLKKDTLVPAMMRWDGQYSDLRLRNHRLVPEPQPPLPSAKRLRPAEGTGSDRDAPQPESHTELAGPFVSKIQESDPMRFTIYQESRVGGRANDEDRTTYCYSRDALLMVVADGMGGHHYGEIAAQIAVQTLADTFQREATPLLADPFRFLQKSMTNAHHAILDYTTRHHLRDTPRTTCVACIVPGQRCLLGARRRFAPVPDA